jgi:predicted transcriptional regulator
MAQDVTEAELAVLQGLWEFGPAPIRRLSEVIYGDASPARYATVQKLLERLEAKGCVARRRDDQAGAAQWFEATVDRETLIGRRLQAVAETLCEGSMAPLLTHLVQAERLSLEDRQALRQLIDDLDQRERSPGRKGR